jgi:hypothetical protein
MAEADPNRTYDRTVPLYLPPASRSRRRSTITVWVWSVLVFGFVVLFQALRRWTALLRHDRSFAHRLTGVCQVLMADHHAARTA